MVERGSDWTDRGINEAIVIRKHPQNVNRNVGWYYLSHLLITPSICYINVEVGNNFI